MQIVKTRKARIATIGAMTSILRCFKVLELLVGEAFELCVSDIAETLFIPRASANRLYKLG